MVISGLDDAEPEYAGTECGLPAQAILPDLLLSRLHDLLQQNRISSGLTFAVSTRNPAKHNMCDVRHTLNDIPACYLRQ